MGNIVRKIAISVLLRKFGRRTIPLGCEAAKDNDDVFINVYGLRDDPNKSCVVRSIDKNEVRCSYFSGDDEKWTSLNIRQFREHKIEVSHFFRGWRLKYDNIYRPTLNILFGINHLQKIVQHRYEHALQLFNDRVELLRILVNLKKPGIDSSISFEEVLTEIYGPRFHKSIGDTHFEHYDHVRFLLLSLQESGDIQCDASKYLVENIVLLPQALKTLSDFEIENTRHKDSLRITRWQLIVAVSMFLLAVATLLLRFRLAPE